MGVHVPVLPNLAKTVKLKSDHYETWPKFLTVLDLSGMFFTVLEYLFTLSRESRKTPQVANSGAMGVWEFKFFDSVVAEIKFCFVENENYHVFILSHWSSW